MSNNYGITDTGFNPKPIDVIEDEYKELLKQFFGSNVDLSQYSVLWKIEQVGAVQDSITWLQAEQNYYNNFIQTASGISLDLLGEDIGLIRKQAISSVVELEIFKNTTSAVTVPAGSLFQTSENIIFTTLIEITIPAGAIDVTTGTVNAEAIESGIAGNVSANTIKFLTNVISGVASSDNDLAAEGGTDIETDSAYRKRLRDFVRATWTAAAIRSAALNVEGVASVKIIELATSYECLVVPQTIFDSELQTAVENAIEPITPVTVEFTVLEAKLVLINVVADVVLSGGLDEATAESQATTQIQEYLTTLDIDDDVIKSKVIQAIMEVINIDNVYNVVLKGKPQLESHIFLTGTDIYPLDYTTGDTITEVTGTVGGSPYTFTETTDYVLLTSPARIDWSPAGTNPDNTTEFLVSYEYPANAIGDVEINQVNIAKLDDVDFTVP
jgi:uncharacterized phage protein gp47/JayE